MDNKFFILCALSLFFADVRGTNPAPGIENFGCEKTAADAFLPEGKVYDISARKNPQSKNILNMLDEEKVRVISKAIGKDCVTRADMVCYLRYLKFSSAKLEEGGTIFAVINERWPWLKSKMEKQESTWIDIKNRYKTAVKQKLSQIFNMEFDRNSAADFFFSMKMYIELLGGDPEKIGNSRFVQRGRYRVWQEMYDHWGVIENYIPGYLSMLRRSGRL